MLKVRVVIEAEVFVELPINNFEEIMTYNMSIKDSNKLIEQHFPNTKTFNDVHFTIKGVHQA